MPILGASIVIGKNRNRIFADGRPQRVASDNNPLSRHWPEARSITPVIEASADRGLELCQQSFADVSTENLMPVRLAPDGGEDYNGQGQPVLDGGNSAVVATNTTVDEDQWSDWDNDAEEEDNDDLPSDNKELSSLLVEETLVVRPKPEVALLTSQVSDNLSDLDIRVKPKKEDSDEMDFFKDMEPVIVKREVDLFAKAEVKEEKEEENEVVGKPSRLTIQAGDKGDDEEGGDAGWGDEDWE